MGFGAIQAVAGGFALVLALAVVWLAHRLKQKNKQLRNAIRELQRGAQEPAPIVVANTPPPVPERTSEPAPTVDAFLWQHLSDTFLWKHLAESKPAPVELARAGSRSIPTGMCDRAALLPLLEADLAFTGLVILVGIAKSRTPRVEHPAQPFIEELLGPVDFACRNGDNEFLIVCPGLRGAEAQRRLNEISERLWNFQLRGQGSFSVLFSWGGIGVENQPLSAAVDSAIERMQQTKRSRVLLFRRKAG
jgi:hypothetical protein